MKIEKELWGLTPMRKQIFKYTITNEKGASVVLSDIGAGIVSVNIPDRKGILDDVVLGYDKPESYFSDGPCAGKCPGRYANRIAGGAFSIDGKTYTLPINNGPNHLHGGPDGFQNKVWESRITGDAVEFMYFSEDGEAGYPGNLKVVAHYEWSEENELKLTFTAEADKTTVINLTNHVYFNLDGFNGSEGIKSHILKLNASEYLPTDESLIPFGESVSVSGTPMDFTVEKPLGKDLKTDFQALNYGKGYDACYVIDGYVEGQLQQAAELYSPSSGRFVEIFTTQPGVQIYTGNWLNGCPEGKKGKTYKDYDAVALECQHFPDSPNHSDYPSTVLQPDEVYTQAIIWSFGVK